MKIENVERAADMVKKYKEIDELIKHFYVSGDEVPDRTGYINVSTGNYGDGDYGVCWELPYNDILSLLESKKSHLKKELMALGVEV